MFGLCLGPELLCFLWGKLFSCADCLGGREREREREREEKDTYGREGDTVLRKRKHTYISPES